MIEVFVKDIDSMELHYEMFRKHMAINVAWPMVDHNVEIGEDSIDNGIF
jgi:hypothetical protein